MNQDDYLRQRLDDQIDWFEKKSAWNQRRYKLWRGLEIVLAATIPLLSGYSETGGVRLSVGLCGVGIAAIAGLLALHKYQENWLQYRTTCEALRRHKFKFLTRVAPYVGESAFARLVQNVEALLAEENEAWSEYAAAERAGGEAAG